MTDASASTGLKLCFRCGTSCAGVKHARDDQGRLYCRECAQRIRDAQRAPGAPPEAAAPPAGAFELAPAAPAPVTRAPALDTAATTGYVKCPECGYSLRGLKIPKCPECGTVIDKKYTRERWLEESSREAVRWAYLRPAILFAVGVLGLTVLRLAQGNFAALGADLLSYAVSVPVGVGAFWLCCLLFFGFDAPMHLTALRLAGIYAVVDFTRELAGLTGIWPLMWGLSAILWIGLLMSELDLDIQDAILYSVVANLTSLAVAGTVALLL